MKTSDFHRQLEDLQFKQVLELDFTSSQHDDQPNKFFVFWNAQGGLLLCHDTFHCGWTLNGGHCYFNWLPKNNRHPEECSGGFEDGIWIGDFDCRNMNRLETLYATGKFLCPWKTRPYLYLCHHGDRDDSERLENLAKITEERILLLPPEVQLAISNGR